MASEHPRPQALAAGYPPDTDALRPLWFETAPPLAEHESIRQLPPGAPIDARADVVVVGAGVTGLSTALHLAERGAQVVVLEREAPGLGTTGRADGQIIAGLHQEPERLIEAYGPEIGERMIAFSGAAPELVFALIARHRMDCDAERSGWIQATRSTRRIASLERLADSWARRGAPVRMLDRAETGRLLGTSAYAGGWLDERNGTIQPFAYARAMALAAARAGAVIHCGVKVERLDQSLVDWSVVTDRGVVRATTVVLAMNVFTGQLEGVPGGRVGHSYLSAHSVQLATAPLSAAQLERVLPRRHSCGDTGHLRLRYFRLDREGRFVIGGPGWLTPPRTAGAMSFRILEASARRMFPALGDTPFEHRWTARDTITPDAVPHLYEPSPGLFAALGYNGRGLAIGTALGNVLARRVLGEPAGAMPFPTTPASSVPLGLRAAAKFYLRLAIGR